MHHVTPVRRITRPFQLSTVIAALLVLLALVVQPALAQEAEQSPEQSLAFDLRPHPKAGQTSRYEIWTSRAQFTSSTFNGESRDASTSIEVNGEMTWTVNSVAANGSYEATMTFDYLTVDVTMPDGSERGVDSRKPSPGEPLAAMHTFVKAMSSVPMQVKMGPDGSVTSIRGVDQIRQMIGEENSPPTEVDFIETASDLTTLLEAPASIRIGGSWTVERTWSREIAQLEADLKTRTTYTLAGVETIAGIEVATVTGETRATLTPQMPEMPAGAPQPRISAKASGNSAVMWDLARHEAVGRNSTENLRLQVDVQTPEVSIQTVVEEVIQSQALRIDEGR